MHTWKSSNDVDRAVQHAVGNQSQHPFVSRVICFESCQSRSLHLHRLDTVGISRCSLTGIYVLFTFLDLPSWALVY